MEKNMYVNFDFLKERVLDSLNMTDLEFIRNELLKLDEPTIISGVGGSSVVSEFTAKVIREKNRIITLNSEPRDFIYRSINGFKNTIACSYSGNNYGVDLSFRNDLKHYLLSNNNFNNKDITYLKYNTSIDKERSFISLGASLIPISILLDYYLEGNQKQITELIKETKFSFDLCNDNYEIFTGYDTSTTSKYLESTLVESGLGMPVIHDKYSYCHGRSTLAINFDNTAIYLNRNTDFDKMLLEEIKKYYSNIIVIDTVFKDSILDDYQMLIQTMYLTKYLASKKGKDLSAVEYSPIVKKLYNYNGNI